MALLITRSEQEFIQLDRFMKYQFEEERDVQHDYPPTHVPAKKNRKKKKKDTKANKVLHKDLHLSTLTNTTNQPHLRQDKGSLCIVYYGHLLSLVSRELPKSTQWWGSPTLLKQTQKNCPHTGMGGDSQLVKTSILL